MALNKNFYDEIVEKEKTWIDMLKSNLLNIFYLPELKSFYLERKQRLDYEFELTGNDIIKSVSFTLNNIIVKLDYIITEDKKGNTIDLNEINEFFLINKLTNNVPYIKKKRKLDQIIDNKKSLYELRNKVVNEGSEDYLDDDFYYNSKVA